MLCSLRSLSLASLTLAIGLQLAAPALALPPDIASRAGRHARRAAEERRAQEEAEQIPADAEVMDDEVEAEDNEPVGTGARHPVRRASHESPVRRAAHFNGPSPAVRNSFVPAHQRIASRSQSHFTQATGSEMESEDELPLPSRKRMLTEGAPPASGHAMQEGEYYGEEEMYNGSGLGPRGFSRNWGDHCNPCCSPCPRIGYFEAFAGAHGFTGPVNRATGSFGFQEGFNAGMPLFCGLTLQAGINATQSNFEGAPFTPDDRTQLFGTLGVFRRVDCGLQAGVVVDSLSDDWDCDLELTQIRGEIGWRMPCGNELGFWFAAGGEQTTTEAQVAFFANDSVAFRTSVLTVEPVDLFAFYYRRQFACGGEGRVFLGATDDNRGLVGGNIRLPLNPCWQFSTDFLYAVADDEAAFPFNDESWNVSFNFVWTPFGQGSGGCQNYCRPLLDVANNGSFLTRLP